ncbi:MAG: hypothetical protein H7Y33_16700, partial [Cytophagales bacterium]|nr:hypothetical protein [Rhizobacter sp.]
MRNALPIRTRLTLLVMVTALPLIALIAYTGYTQARQDAQQASAEALRAARAAAIETQAMLGNARQLLGHLSQRPGVNALDATRCDPIFASFRGLFPYYTNLITVNRGGERVCSAIPAPPNAPRRIDNSAMPLEAALRSGQFSVGQVSRGVLSGRWILLVALPLP